MAKILVDYHITPTCFELYRSTQHPQPDTHRPQQDYAHTLKGTAAKH
jgi:hypothetical protein